LSVQIRTVVAAARWVVADAAATHSIAAARTANIAAPTREMRFFIVLLPPLLENTGARAHDAGIAACGALPQRL
jgi:hypothetical protein